MSMIELPFKTGDNTYITLVDLNIRTGPGSHYPLQSRDKMTEDGRKHSEGSILKRGTRVTVKEFIVNPFDSCAWLRIPSGYICAVEDDKQYIKETENYGRK